MIRVDISELEKMAELLLTMASNTDENLNMLRRISAEMNEDLELQTYPQSKVALEAVALSVDSLNQANDTLQSLKNVILNAVNDYQQNEKKHKNVLERMNNRLQAIRQGYDAAITPGEIANVEVASEITNHNQVQELVAGSMQEMQVTNISAISKTIEEEYPVEEVKDIDTRQD